MNQLRFEVSVKHLGSTTPLRALIRVALMRAFRGHLIHAPVRSRDTESFQLRIEDGDVIELALPLGNVSLSVIDGRLAITVPKKLGVLVRTALGDASMVACNQVSNTYSPNWRVGDSVGLPTQNMGVKVRLTYIGREWD